MENKPQTTLIDYVEYILSILPDVVVHFGWAKSKTQAKKYIKQWINDKSLTLHIDKQ